ncbi:MAG: TIGR04086 family membrane protein [Clostridiales bacterium]|nr:TIGR04086 family membrane protein [Clostridiales bacterium]
MSSYTTPTMNRPLRRRASRNRKTIWSRLLRGLLTAVGVTLLCVLLFALLMQWLKPSDNVIRIINQVIKLGSIFAGVYVTVGRSGENGLLLGAGVGLVYMLLGVLLYALLSGQQLPWTAYLSDIAMGIAGGGIAGAIVAGMRKR